MEGLKKGYIQIYTGNGKGKTTAALGLALRAAGSGLAVYMVQFLKASVSGELESSVKLQPNFKIFRFEKKRGFFWNLGEEEKQELKKEIQEAYNFCVKTLEEKSCDVLILDELMGALSNGMVSLEQVLKLLDIKPDNVEMVITGRNVPPELMERADLITEMKDIKHYYKEGVKARKGIEY